MSTKGYIDDQIAMFDGTTRVVVSGANSDVSLTANTTELTNGNT